VSDMSQLIPTANVCGLVRGTLVCRYQPDIRLSAGESPPLVDQRVRLHDHMSLHAHRRALAAFT
jgi:hypothetical protein